MERVVNYCALIAVTNSTCLPLPRAQVIPWLKTAVRGRTIKGNYFNKQFVLKPLTPHTHPPWPLFGNMWGKHHSLSRNSSVAVALFWFVPVVFCHLEWCCDGLVHQGKGSQTCCHFYFAPRFQLLHSTWRSAHSSGVEESSVWTANAASRASPCADFNYRLQERCPCLRNT